jgi:exopolyphosphatase/guanosine-5'-triphosphate,3'-diphosphate pyrophosphatase
MRIKSVEDRDIGAGAPAAGVSGAFQPASGVERASGGGNGVSPSVSGRQTDLQPHPKKRRRKRKRGRKVFARETTPVPGSASGHPSGQLNAKPHAVLQHATQPVPVPTAHRESRQPRPADLPVFAALDLGTNNCRLLVAVPGRPGQFRVIDAFSRIVRLGEGLAANGRLSDVAMTRAVEALKVCGDKLRLRTLEKARLIATEACRAAANGAEFLERVRTETGLDLEIIDRQTEARLAVSGCGSLVERDTDGVVLFDIGGGSSEIALIDVRGQRSPRLANHIVAWTSLPVGVVTLAERFGGRDVTRATFAAMVTHVRELLDAFVDRSRLDHVRDSVRFHLLGTSGTVTTLAGVHLDLERYDRRRVDGLWMDRTSVDGMVEKLLGWDFEQRVGNACIGPDRADLVLAGCAILEAIRAEWPSDRLRVADRGLREGILSELMGDAGVWRRGWRGGARP